MRTLLIGWMMMTGVLASAFPPVKIVLVGDSTINPEGGWGPGFTAAMKGDFEVVNLAMNGRSSKSFRDEGRWAKALELKPDYIVIEFGHNDVPGKGPKLETDAKTIYRGNLARYVDEARAIGAKPVLATSIVRRNFGPDGKFKPDSLGPYVEVTRELAAEMHVPLMEMYEATRAQAEELGNAGCEAEVGAITKDGKPDHTHLGAKGQTSIGAIAAREFLRVVPALAK